VSSAGRPAKRRRHLSVRHLFDRIPNLLLKLKPCLFMSPLSVSQFLPPEKFKFDLVIFDEASQIFTEDAVGAIYRGRQLVVAGDSKQLPPTDFFKSIDTDSDDDDENPSEDETSADFNSVLDECETIRGIRLCSLRWHYRSRHESLIAFSNHRFYDSRLITFPSARHQHQTLGIELVHLPDGVYDRGGKRINQREAESVAARVFAHFAQYPQKSIGVVAFSQAQMMAIEDEIERRRKTNAAFEHFFREDRLEGFFVKNLENVQGDERDVIIFSIGYGRDQHGRITMAFGPLVVFQKWRWPSLHCPSKGIAVDK
jgi:superfamily I DNA and/or RNA helicase